MSKQPTFTATSPYHLRIRATIQRDVPSVFSPNPTHPMEMPTPYASPPSSGLQTKLQLVSCAYTYRHDPSHLPLTLELLHLLAPTFQIHSPRSPVHSSNCLPGTLSTLTHCPAPSHSCSMPIHSPHFFQGYFSVLFLLSCPPATPSPTWPWTFSLASKKCSYSYQGPQCHGPRQHCPH